MLIYLMYTQGQDTALKDLLQGSNFEQQQAAEPLEQQVENSLFEACRKASAFPQGGCQA